ncbi:glycosyltransferase [Vibrio cidicii]|uniref:glycosyltransferase n=1 Tax=Vibrio cidicii TaxID=1763883 RepID=UPI000A7B0673|nr:glycosyltransferase [Vibrio cidicii]
MLDSNWTVYERFNDGHRSGYVEYFKSKFEAFKTNKLINCVDKNVIFPTLDGNEFPFVFIAIISLLTRKKIIALSIRPHESRSWLKYFCWKYVVGFIIRFGNVRLISPIKHENAKVGDRSILYMFDYFPDPELIMSENVSFATNEVIFDLAMLGEIKENKNINLFVNLVSELKSSNVCVGRVSDERIVNKLANLGDNLEVVNGRVSDAAFYDYISKSKFVFCLYLKDQSSGVLFKSLRMGKPVLIWNDSIISKFDFIGAVRISRDMSVFDILNELDKFTISQEEILVNFNNIVQKEVFLADDFITRIRRSNDEL